MSMAALRAARTVRGISGTQKLVLLALADMASDHGECWPSAQTLAEDCCISVRTVRFALAELEALGLLQRLRKGRTVRWRLVLDEGARRRIAAEPAQQPGEAGSVNLVHTSGESESAGNGTRSVNLVHSKCAGDSPNPSRTPIEAIPPLPPTPAGAGGEQAGPEDRRPRGWAGQYRGLRATGTNPRALARPAHSPAPPLEEFGGHPLAGLLAEVGPVHFRSWLRHLRVDRYGDEVRVIAPNAFLRDWNRQHYGDQIKRLLRAPEVRFVVAAGCA